MAWVEYTGSFKDAISVSKTDGAPFKTVRGPKDEYTWQDSGKLLKLHENTWSSSGALHLRVAEGWRVAFRIATENTDYFQDNVRDEYLVEGEMGDDPTHNEVDEVWVYEDKDFWQENQSNVVFTLYEDDYLSIDVDGDHSNIANFSLNKGTVDYDVSTDREMSDDTFVRMIKAWMWVDDLPPTTHDLTEEDGSEEGDTVDYEGNFNENEVITDDDIKEGNKTGETTPTPKPEDEQVPTIDPIVKEEDGDNDSTIKDDDEDDDDSDDDDDDASNYSIILVLGAVVAIIVGAILVLRGGSSAE